MKKSLIRSLVLVLACAAFVFVGQSFSYLAKDPAPVTSDLRNARAQSIDSNLLVWGVNAANGVTISLYNPKLVVIRAYEKNVPGFAAAYANVEVVQDSLYHVQLTNIDGSKTMHMRLNSKLQEKWSTKLLTVSNQNPSKVQVMSDEYGEREQYLLQTANFVVNGKNRRMTQLERKSLFDSLASENWNLILDSSAIEYGKVLSVRNGRLYVYVNHSMKIGQFIYCFEAKDGKEIYKTKLQVKQTDFKRGEAMSSPEKFDKSEGCIYSNHIWDERTKRLTLAGTWMSTSPNEVGGWRSTGLFIMQLNEDGTVNACDADYNYWLHTNTTGADHQGDGFFSRNSESYYRVADMGYESDGAFSVFTEIYARVNLWSPQKAGQKEFIYLQDSLYHYYTVQKHVYSIMAGSIRPKCQECIVRVVPWAANYHLDSIKGFVPQKTKLYDEQYPDNINQICDASRADGHFAAGLRKLRGKNGTKVLTKNQVDVNGKISTAYFTKTLYVPTANWMAFLSPDPVKGQDFAKPAEYFAANSEWLYRWEGSTGGFTLRMVKW